MLSPPTALKYVFLSWSAYYALAVLFGAPIFSDIASTAVLATSLTVVSTVPIVLVFGSEEKILDVICFSNDPVLVAKESVVLYISAFALVSAWASAAVHPLDWDRWWQRYPLPSLFGCAAGASLGLLVGLFAVWINSSKKSKRR